MKLGDATNIGGQESLEPELDKRRGTGRPAARVHPKQSVEVNREASGCQGNSDITNWLFELNIDKNTIRGNS